MLITIAIVLFIVIVGIHWWLGTWNALINLINFFLAAMVASSFYENIAWEIDNADSSFRPIADFIAIWLVFFLTFGALRAATDLLSRYQLRLDGWLDIAGRSVFSLILALAFLSFTFFTLHMAPLPPHAYPSSSNQRVLGVGPDRVWLAFLRAASAGSLAESKQAPMLPDYIPDERFPDEAAIDARLFRKPEVFISDWIESRTALSEQETLRTNAR